MPATDVFHRLDGRDPSIEGSDVATARVPRPRRRLVVGLGAVVVTGIAIAVLVTTRSGDDGEAEATGGPAAVASAEVRDLVRTEAFEGELGFGEGQELAAGRAGVTTAIAATGTTLVEGDVAYSIDLEPTVLLEGDVPAYRSLSTDSDDGPDVTQLERALVDLGVAPDLTVDEDFTSSTADAVEAWEETLGRADPDGTVELGDVLFTTGPRRISDQVVDVGASVQAGAPILTVTSTDKVITLDLPANRSGILAAGAAVEVTLPDGSVATGTVTTVGTETEADPSSPDAEPAIPVTVTLDDPAAAGDVDTGTVDVVVERSRVEDAVAVPVTALLALAEGGYAVEVVDGSAATGTRLVPVEVGAYADGFVQVTADSIANGTEVVVAA